MSLIYPRSHCLVLGARPQRRLNQLILLLQVAGDPIDHITGGLAKPIGFCFFFMKLRLKVHFIRAPRMSIADLLHLTASLIQTLVCEIAQFKVVYFGWLGGIRLPT